MGKLTRSIAVVALVLASLLAFAGVASAQESPTYTGISPTTVQTQPQSQAQGAQVAQAAQTAGTLPYTGNDSLPLAQIGVGLLAVGAITTIAVRRRQATNA